MTLGRGQPDSRWETITQPNAAISPHYSPPTSSSPGTIHHGPGVNFESRTESQLASQRAWLNNATRHLRTSNRPSVHLQPLSQSRRLRNPTGSASQPANAPQPVLPSQLYLPEAQSTPCKPCIRYAPHPDSRILQDFHWVPYPLGLLPYDSWHQLHHGPDVFPPLPFRCPICKKERKVSAHLRKVYLVAERLSWDDELVTVPDRNLNEESNWAVNYELGILDPFVEEPGQVTGGKHSQKNMFHPYQNEFEMKEALRLIFTSEDITNVRWDLWIALQEDLQRMIGNEEVHAPTSRPAYGPQSASETPLSEMSVNARQHTGNEEMNLMLSPQFMAGPSYEVAAPSLSSLGKGVANRVASHSNAQATLGTPLACSIDQELPSQDAHATQASTSSRIVSYKTLQDFYFLLDRIERTSYVGALFLEAYAERLRNDMCKDCWFERYIAEPA